MQNTQLHFEAVQKGSDTIIVYETVTGRELLKKTIDTKTSGDQQVNLQLPMLREGIYPVRIEMKEGSVYDKISIQ